MCAILDTNTAHEVFGSKTTEAGEGFREWIRRGNKLVVGGKLKEELLRGVPGFHKWASEGQRASGQRNSRLENVDDNRVNKKTEEIKQRDDLQSDDPHIIALARVSGARLLFSNDKDLQDDFGNSEITNNPRGKIYSTSENTNFTKDKRDLLERHRCRLGN